MCVYCVYLLCIYTHTDTHACIYLRNIQFNSIFIYIAHLKTTMVDQSASQCPEKLPHKQNEYSKTSQCLNSTQNKSQGKQVCLKK